MTHSIEGLFGNIIHFDDYGNRAGESIPGVIPGTYTHYDSDGEAFAETRPGLFDDLYHSDMSGEQLGWSAPNIVPLFAHYNAAGERAGETNVSLTGYDTTFDF
jgi:hypothetical protein